ncbi:hypothetical protein A2356_00250 [Candidatus Nomurabacteria bacterium RIFOXYB1_FULL_39_16]|uniref:Uncharacterized protein n=2 Tax=Candidatus Nomuraibacteriota TaxID=1752729 RepID=A0A0G0T3F1_9BACT|nr:MAG: hypothetical protein UT78_C0023G0006 [Candidatus Nomurabacteria bacterium GW2011_GWF2_40_12]OGJ09279.1 MAG: hypothetical protein A2356_00250 [Candidatus Nomurabacteria bacterium RIFOXYB1_FULL_39_16]OGJ15328.1 MAG: hypothetical protein A2585_01165 [Candidatus Nomurabacteria bacterium RIFOXYD1_FULL_39_12]
MPKYLLAENRGRAVDEPAAVKPVDVPAPLAVVPVEIQDVPVAVRVLQNRTVEVDEPDVPVDLLLPALGDEMLVLPESLEDLRVQADVTFLLQALELFLALDGCLPILKHRLEANLREVEFRERNGTSVRLVVENLPSFADESGVERNGTVDGDDARIDEELCSVLEEGSELFPRLLRVRDDRLLQPAGCEIDRVPVGIQGECRHDRVGLVESDLSHRHSPSASGLLCSHSQKIPSFKHLLAMTTFRK